MGGGSNQKMIKCDMGGEGAEKPEFRSDIVFVWPLVCLVCLFEILNSPLCLSIHQPRENESTSRGVVDSETRTKPSKFSSRLLNWNAVMAECDFWWSLLFRLSVSSVKACGHDNFAIAFFLRPLGWLNLLKAVWSFCYTHPSAHVGEVGEEGRWPRFFWISYQDTESDLLKK